MSLYGAKENPREDEKTLNELKTKFQESQRWTRQMFLANYGEPHGYVKDAQQLNLAVKINAEYATVKNMAPPVPVAKVAVAAPATKATDAVIETVQEEEEKAPEKPVKKPLTGVGAQLAAVDKELAQLIENMPKNADEVAQQQGGQLVTYKGGVLDHLNPRAAMLLRQRERLRAQPKWHAPWVHTRIISGHLGWVRCVAVDPANEWFVTGAADRQIKIWDLASGVLKLTLTGHISAVRGLAVSARHPYLFSVSEDKTVKCWDLESNKVVRSYHGHLSGVYTCNLHPTLDVLFSGGRDSTCRVWDIRTKSQIRVLAGHTNTISSIQSQAVDPQVITGSHDSTVRCWDLIAGKSTAVLTNHKKSVRSVIIHPSEYTFLSASPDNMKVWKCPEATFLRNISGHNAIVNATAINSDNVLVSGGDNGSLNFWDWKTGYNFQQIMGVAQPGSLDSENGVLAMAFDQTGSRLITCEADKSIKIYKEDDTATEDSHPVTFKPDLKRKRY